MAERYVQKLIDRLDALAKGSPNQIYAGAWLALSRLRAENERLAARVSALVTALDRQHGTPCEQIRHQNEVEDLQAQLTAARAEWERAVEMIARYREPILWAMIDEYADDDDWNGSTALNARQGSLERARAALTGASEKGTTGGE